MRIIGVSGAFPAHRYPQGEITDAFADFVTGQEADPVLVRRIHAGAGVEYRNLALPLERYPALRDFGESNDAYIDVGVEVGGRALADALKQAGLTPDDVDVVVLVSVTGFAVPTLDARIAAAVGLRPDVRRMPLIGLGCVAGASGLSRLHDYLLGHPDHVGALVSVELCSLTVQRDDPSTANVVASALFGDGAAAVVAAGRDRAAGLDLSTLPQGGPSVCGSVSHLYPDTERAMGWDVGPTGFRVVLGTEVPRLVAEHLGDDVDRFLAGVGLARGDIDWWVAHPGGPKVLQAMRDALGLTDVDVSLTWRSLAAQGNLSSASVLQVLGDTLRDRPPPAGAYGLLLAMGPGFCSELVLLQAAGGS